MTESNLALSRDDARGAGGGRSDAVTDRLRRRNPLAPEPASALAARAATLLAGGSEPTIDLQLHGELAEAEQEWRAFEQQADRTAFQSFDWLAAWQRHVGSRRATRPAIVFGRDGSGHLLFILPLAIERRGLLRRLTWLGSELCDYNAPLLTEHFTERIGGDGRFAAVWRDVLKRLRAEQRFRFDLIDLQKMPEAIGPQPNPFLQMKVRPNPSGAYVASLGADWETFYTAKRSSSTRKRERRQLKHLAEFGELRFVEVQDNDDMALTLATLMQQKSRALRRMGVADIFALPGYREFFLEVATTLNVRALTHVSRLEVGATTAAINFGLCFRDSYYLVLSSYHDGEMSRFGPGRAHLHELMRRAIERGFQKFDFTIGDEPYKRDWSDHELRLYDHLTSVTIRGALATGVIAVLRRTKRVFKQTPLLWQACLRVRELIGLLRRR